MYGYQPIIPSDFNELLLSYRQESIFKLVFGYSPIDGVFVTSPFREDKNAGCWFEWNQERLIFKDFAESKGHRQRDCFQAVKDYYKLNDFKQVIEFIVKNLDGQEEEELDITCVGFTTPQQKHNKSEVKILPHVKRFFEEKDRLTWSPFEITEENLKEDKVLPLQSYVIFKKEKTTFIKPFLPSFLIYNKDNRVKIYTPKSRSKKGKWITTCNQNDIGNYDNIDLMGERLLITKSYKDYRVIRNQDLFNTIWFQNEGAFPDLEILYDLAIRFEQIFILFDNDQQGIESAQALIAIFQSLGKEAKMFYSPYHYLKDPAEIIFAKGKTELNRFLWENFQK